MRTFDLEEQKKRMLAVGLLGVARELAEVPAGMRNWEKANSVGRM